MNTVRIGVFDSGIGGMSVLRHLVSLLPQMHYVYLGDTARVPYGNKSPQTIAHYATQCAVFLRQRQVDIVVVACNTISAIALDIVESIADIPVVGMIEPAVRAALEQSSNRRIGVIGTRATIESQAYELALYTHGGSTVTVVQHACPLLVPLAEEGWIAHPATYAIIEEYLQPLIKEKIDTLILGCTHFPLLADTIEKVADVKLIDPGYWAARQIRQLLGMSLESSPPCCAPRIEYYLSDTASNFSAVARQFLGFEVGPIHSINLDQVSIIATVK